MNIVDVEPLGHWATTTLECDCGLQTTHIYLIGSVDELDCGKCGKVYVLGWEVMTEPEDGPTPN